MTAAPSHHVLHVRRLEHREPHAVGGADQPRDLRVPVALLQVLVPQMQEQQLRGQLLGRGRVALGREAGLLLWVALQRQVPHLMGLGSARVGGCGGCWIWCSIEGLVLGLLQLEWAWVSMSVQFGGGEEGCCCRAGQLKNVGR